MYLTTGVCLLSPCVGCPGSRCGWSYLTCPKARSDSAILRRYHPSCCSSLFKSLGIYSTCLWHYLTSWIQVWPAQGDCRSQAGQGTHKLRTLLPPPLQSLSCLPSPSLDAISHSYTLMHLSCWRPLPLVHAHIQHVHILVDHVTLSIS